MTPEDKQKRLRYLQLKKKKAVAMASQPPAEKPASERSFRENLVEDARNQVMGVAGLGKALVKSGGQMAMGDPFYKTDAGQIVGEMVRDIPNMPGQAVKRAGEIISDPWKAIKEKPITTTLDLASVVPAAGMAARGAKTAASAAGRVGRGFGVRAIEATMGAPRQAIERRLARPTQVRSAIPEGAVETPYAPLADDLAKAVNRTGEMARKSASVADESLSSSRYLMDRALPKDDLLKVIDREKSRLRTQGTVVGNARTQAMANLNKIRGQVKKMRGETVSERNVKDLVKSLDPDIDWNVKTQGPSNLSLTRVRKKFDSKLKKNNPKYREDIAPAARQMRIYERSKRHFGLDKEVGSGFVPTDATVSKMKSIGGGKVPMSERRLAQLEKEAGGDFTNRARDIDAALKFEGGATQGSRRIGSFGGIGAALGGLFGGPGGAAVGGASGAILGLITDTNGRKMAAKLIDSYLAIKPTATATEIVSASPQLSMIIRRSLEAKQPRRALAAYATSRSIPTENR